jgi:hypothetical protein
LAIQSFATSSRREAVTRTQSPARAQCQIDRAESRATDASLRRRPDVDDERTASGHFGDAALREFRRCGGVRGAAGGIEAEDLFRLRVVDEREQVAADAVHARLDHGEHGRGGHGGIDRVAAGLQDLQACRGRKRLARGDHAAASDGGRARAVDVSRRAIA